MVKNYKNSVNDITKTTDIYHRCVREKNQLSKLSFSFYLLIWAFMKLYVDDFYSYNTYWCSDYITSSLNCNYCFIKDYLSDKHF